MYDGGKIIAGLVIFFFLLTFPFWYNLGQAAYEDPDLLLPEDETECIEPTEWMRANHMELLDTWRDLSTRDRLTQYTSSTGKTMEVSLQKTCMSCHTNRSEFCDKCHDQAAVSPYCWDCHIAPEEVANAQ